MKNIINKILIFFIIIGVLYIFLNVYKEEKIKDKEGIKSKQYYSKKLENKIKDTIQHLEESKKENSDKIESQILEDNNNQEKIIKEYPKEEVIKEYNGYPVIAKLKIPKIELETYILENYSESALNISVTKFWGANPNEIGNFCIVGHNFKRNNMFHNLKNLELGDRLFISDNNVGIVEYEIYDLYKVMPEDISVLSQETDVKQVTLITCTSDSKKRIIVKAKEV